MNDASRTLVMGRKNDSSGTPSSTLEGNLQHTQFAAFADAHLPLAELRQWVDAKRLLDPALVLFAQFEEGRFSNQRLEALMVIGFDGYLIGVPSAKIVYKLCERIRGYIACESEKYGSVRLKGTVLYRGTKSISLTKKEELTLRMLFEVCGKPVPRSKLLKNFGYLANTNTHTIETHIYRLRIKLQSLGMEKVIVSVAKEGYCLQL